MLFLTSEHPEAPELVEKLKERKVIGKHVELVNSVPLDDGKGYRMVLRGISHRTLEEEASCFLWNFVNAK